VPNITTIIIAFSKCGVCYNADKVNKLFEIELAKHTIDPIVAKLYKELVIEAYDATGSYKQNIIHLKRELNTYVEKINKARDLLLSGDIDGAEFRQIKSDSER
jgi:site-specific DNA recombinase